MSKSAGNVILVKDIIEKGFDPLALRLAFLESKYRNQLDLSWDAIKAADKTLKRWRLRVSEWDSEHPDVADLSKIDVASDVEEYLKIIRNDLDFPRALVKLRALEKNTAIDSLHKLAIFVTLDKIFGLNLKSH